MARRLLRFLVSLILTLGVSRVLSAQAPDTAGTGALIADAMDHSEIMANLGYLTDVIGPRLSSSPAMRRANEWTAERFKAYGLTTALEPYRFGVAWHRGAATARLLAPFTRAVTAHSWGWTVGTGGRAVAGPIVRIDVTTAESLAVYRDRVQGAWVLTDPVATIWNPDGPVPTAQDSAQVREQQRRRALLTADTSAAAVTARRQFAIDLPYLLKAAGARGILLDGNKEHALMRMSGSPRAVRPLPTLVVAHEDYALFDRLLARGITPRFAGRADNVVGRAPVTQWNTVAEIKGSERPDEVVILGAHLDSWDLGTGVTDNGAGSMVVLEAARLLSRAPRPPKRTVRFILFSGEEQGLIGSTAYAAAHAGEAGKVQAVLVLDNGTGAITGQALQGRKDLEELWRQLLAPVAGMGAGQVRDAMKTGTDHLSFLPYGIPGFNFDQLPRGYNHTHHSASDTYDKAVEGDLKQAAAVMAVTAYQLANLPGLLPRGPVTSPPVYPSGPSPAVRLPSR